MRLHGSHTSPFVRKCLVLLHETGQIDSIELVQTGGTPLDSSAMPLAQNPLGKIPVLERPEGPALYDSRVITQYLDHRAGARLYPEAPHLWDVLTLEATADGMLDAAVTMVYEDRIRPEGTSVAALKDAWWAKIARSIDALEARWIGHLAGPMTMGQIAMGCALGYLDFRHDARNWRADAPALSDWYAGFAERPSMQATVPPAG
ncbi:glutathione S-transferase [Meridianimarinicoccus sp. MJW13]|uniref:glutathione S-transferase n=1 Tax=Meridianimarinicoccus sp. MJW13 TaxID=2720031 RepID=UPI001868D845|nr:glutathione S-transferase [Fluviibacterium sp. MJW13]